MILGNVDLLAIDSRHAVFITRNGVIFGRIALSVEVAGWGYKPRFDATQRTLLRNTRIDNIVILLL